MKISGQCPKCSSREVIRGTTSSTGDTGGDLLVSTYQDPTAFVFKGKRSSSLLAYVCGKCGYVEFYAIEPRVLFKEENA
jgi:predicted nucleic-acid-binding Zn-ribbon protein